MNSAKTAWRPPLLVKTSLVLHGGAAALMIVQPSLWPWTLGAVAANHCVLAGTGLWPRSTWLGRNLLRLPPEAVARREVCITIDDGPEPAVTPQVLDILARFDARATFFCIGSRVREHASLAREIVAAGHHIENHSENHLHRFSVLGPSAMEREVAQAQASIESVCGRRPRYFRAPAGLRNPFLDKVLHGQNMTLASWTRRGFDTRESNVDVVLRRLTRNLAAGDILLLHDGNAACRAGEKPVILEALPRLLETLAERGLKTANLGA